MKKKASGLSFGLYHQNLNICGWLLEIDIFIAGEVGMLDVAGGLTGKGWGRVKLYQIS